jgi:magnesium transporter
MSSVLSATALRQRLSTDQHGVQKLCAEAHPVDVARALSELDLSEVWTVLEVCEPRLRAEIFTHLTVDIQSGLSETLPRDDLALLVSEMPPDERVDLIQRLPAPRREAVLGAMARAEREDVLKLASYPEGTVGAVMTSDYVSLTPGLTTGAAIDKLRLEAPNKETIYTAYVVDGLRRLVGLVSLKDLILARPGTQVADIAHREVISARVADDQEDAARKIQRYGLIALPVTNGDGVLVGIVTHDDAMDILTEEQTEDIEKLMAIGGPHTSEGYLLTSPWRHFRKRVGWIVALAALGLVSGLIVQRFEGMLLQLAILATFMPMLADTGGNTGSQSATLVVRALALGEIRPGDVARVLFKELMVALPLGLVLAGLAFTRVMLAGGHGIPAGTAPAMIGVAVAAALGLQVVSATLLGALLPLAADRLRLDPAIVASPALTTVVDISGLAIFFVTVKLVLGL